MSTQPRLNFVVQAQPGASYAEVNRLLNEEIRRTKEAYFNEYGDEPVEVVILPDYHGTGPRGYVFRGLLWKQMREAKP